MNEKQSALIGFAVLRANYNADAPNYIDNFTGFAVDVLVRSHPKSLGAHGVSEDIGRAFGLTIPALVVEKILHSAVRLKLAEGDRNGYTASPRALKQSQSLTADIQRYARQQAELAKTFAAFVESTYPEHAAMLGRDPADELGRYLQAHAIPLLAQSLRGTTAAQDEMAPGSEYLISRFITHLSITDQTSFSYVEDAAKGAILAAVIELDTSSFSQSLKSLSIYLDTPVLIDLLGFHGAVSFNAMDQFVRLARGLGASVYAFDHSVRELEGILHSAESFVKNGRVSGVLPRTVLHFQDSGLSAADVAIAREKLPELLSAAQVKVKDKPGNYASYGLDENDLEDTLQEHIHYRFMSARRHDAESISAIHRLREGRSPNKLENCRYVFVTNNNELTRAAGRIHNENHLWPLVMTDVALAALLWVRSPAVDVELPRTLLLATAYAGMQPDGRLWHKYLDEVEQLEKRGDVNPDDALILRTTSVAKVALMDETLGVANGVQVSDVLRRVRDGLARPFVEQAAELALSEQSTRNDLEVAEQSRESSGAVISALEARLAEVDRISAEQVAERDRNIRSRAENRARHHVALSTLVLGVLLGLFSSVALWVEPFSGVLWPWIKYASGLCTVLLIVVAAVTALVPNSLTAWISGPIQRVMSRKYENGVRVAAGLAPRTEVMPGD